MQGEWVCGEWWLIWGCGCRGEGDVCVVVHGGVMDVGGRVVGVWRGRGVVVMYMHSR